MSSAPKWRVLPGVVAALLPWLFQVTWAVLLVAWLGGLDELSRLLGMAGPSFHRMVALSLVSTGALALTLFLLGAGRAVPLAVPAVFAAVPWWLGVAGALQGIPPVLAAVAGLPPEDQGPMLMQGAGELQCLRLLGAWSAAALLGATAAGLLLAGRVHRGAGEQPSAPSSQEWNREAALVGLLGLVAWVSAFEAQQVSQVFLAVVGAEAADRSALLAAGAEQLRLLGLLRMGALTGLVLVLLGLGRRRLARRPREPVAVGSLALVVLLGVGTLWVDGRPLARMRDALEQTGAR